MHCDNQGASQWLSQTEYHIEASIQHVPRCDTVHMDCITAAASCVASISRLRRRQCAMHCVPAQVMPESHKTRQAGFTGVASHTMSFLRSDELPARRVPLHRLRHVRTASRPVYLRHDTSQSGNYSDNHRNVTRRPGSRNLMVANVFIGLAMSRPIFG